MGTPRYSDRLCSDRHYSDNLQSGRRRRVVDCSWIGLRAVPIGNTLNRIPKIRGSTIVLEPWRYVVTFPEEGQPRPHQDSLDSQAPLPSVPRWMPCFQCMWHLNPLQFSPNFYYFYSVLKMLTVVVLTVDCRNSVCLPLNGTHWKQYHARMINRLMVAAIWFTIITTFLVALAELASDKYNATCLSQANSARRYCDSSCLLVRVCLSVRSLTCVVAEYLENGWR